MAKQTRVTVDLKQLEKFTREIGGDYVARVGIIGAKSDEQHLGTEMTNAELGLIHEFGSESRNIPPRSFLRMPLEARQQTIIQQMGKRRTREKLERGDTLGVIADLGLAAEAVIQGAFTSGGFGQWPQNTPETIAAKGSSQPLIDTSQLRRAISSDVVRKKDL